MVVPFCDHFVKRSVNVILSYIVNTNGTFMSQVFLTAWCVCALLLIIACYCISECVVGYVLDGVPCLDGEWMSPAQQMAWLFGSKWKPNIIIIIKVCILYCTHSVHAVWLVLGDTISTADTINTPTILVPDGAGLEHYRNNWVCAIQDTE